MLRCDICKKSKEWNEIRSPIGQYLTPDDTREYMVHIGIQVCYDCYPKTKKLYGKNLRY
jgi:hypothetical protein